MIGPAARLVRVARRVSRRAVLRPRRAHGLILLYHRVAAPSWDPWNNCVYPERFERQLQALARVADVVPLAELVPRLRAGRRGRPVVAITFDDGYADNLHVALPLLERHGIPATVFIATSWIGRPEPFWWDRLSDIVRAIGRLPPEVRLPLGGGEFTWRRRSGSGHDRRERDRLHLALWARLVLATDEERCAALDELRRYADTEPEVDPATRPMTVDELRRLASSRVVEIGAHTMSHCSLPDLPPDAQLAEIIGCRRQCRDLTGEFPTSFAYPFGGLAAGTPGLVRSAGFERACSSENDLVWAGNDLMLLPRIQVRNYSAREFSMRMRMEWLP